MKVLATDEVVRFITERGGVLFVWADRIESFSSTAYLEASVDSPGAERRFRRFTGGGFDLLFDGGGELPDELHLILSGWLRKRVRAYWNGASFLRAAPSA
jgi:hypothetical protein